MFERVTVRHRSTSIEQAIDLGVLAEALIFYSEVIFVADYPVLRALLTKVAPEILLELVESGFLRLAYEADRLAVMTEASGSDQERYDAVYYTAPRHQLQNALPDILTEVTGKSGMGRRLANRLSRHIEVVHLSDSTTADAREKLGADAYVSQAVRLLLNRLAPEYAGGAEFRVVRDGKMFRAETDIDFQQANLWYHKRVPPKDATLTTAFLLAHVVNVETDLLVAARFGGELAIDEVNSDLIRLNVDDILRTSRPGREQVEAFQDFVFDDSRAIGESVRSGRSSIADVLAVLPQAKKFHQWIRRDDVTPDVVKAYFREATASTWVDRLPAKSARWSIFTAAGVLLDVAGAGGLGTTAGVAAGAFDTFLLDRLLKGWKPTQFVEQMRPIFEPDPKG